MSKNFIPVLLILILGGLFITYGVMGSSDKQNNDPKQKYQRILRNVGIVLEQGHYNPREINDEFSEDVLQKYVETLDPDKYIFLQSDIKSFNKYKDRIDDEIHGAPIESFYFISDKYTQRLSEISTIAQEILKNPFDFSINETLQTDGAKRNFPATSEDRHDYYRKRLKYMVLGRFVDLQNQREKRNADSAYKADSTLLNEAVDKVSRQLDRYFETLKNHNTTDEMFSTFVNAITSTMDPHTTYFAPIDKRTFDEMLSGTFFGIGAQLQESGGSIKIVSLITGMPAWKSGEIQPEDVIIKVGEGDATPVDVTGYALSDAVKLIRGKERGSEVRLTLKKADGTIKEVSLLRDKISLEATYARSAIINGKHKIGYIYLPEFYADFNDPTARRSSTDVAKEVKKLKAENVDGIVIDLRGNGGGSLQDVVDMVGLFIKDGPIVQVKGREEKATILNDRNNEVLYGGPLAVMVDELSASASEIFAAAIQDYHRGIVIGSSSTYGKGTVQRSISLDPSSRNDLFSNPTEGLGNIKLTFRKFYRINGGTTQLHGVIPDIIIPDRLENAKFREKDNPNSLAWDEISKADYSTWKPGYSFKPIVAEVNAQINQNTNFEGISKAVDKLDKFKNKEAPLNITKYKEMQEELKAISDKLDAYTQSTSDLLVNSITKDSLEIRNDTTKIKVQTQFLKGISNDIYVDETVKVINKMIGEEAIVQRNSKVMAD